MIFLVILGYAMWGYLLLCLLLGRKLESAEYVLMYPVGLAMTGLFLFSGWMSTLPFRFLVLVWWFGAGLGTIWFMQSYRGQPGKWWRNIQISVQHFSLRSWLAEQHALVLLILLAMMAVAGLAVAIGLMWQTFLHPVAWDTVALYDFRALRIAEGWQPADFMTQFARMPEYRAYDFLHPMTSSIWWAVAYSSGAQHVLLLYAVLLGHAIALGWTLWKHLASRVVWLFLWLGWAPFFLSLTEGYAAYPAVLFWALALLWWYRLTQVSSAMSYRQWMVVGILILGSVSARITEYFWAVLGVVMLGYGMHLYRFQMMKTVKSLIAVWLLPLTSLGLWFWLRAQAVAVSASVSGDRSVTALLEQTRRGLAVSFTEIVWQEIGAWLQAPVFPWLAIVLMGAGIVWWSQRRWPRIWNIWAALEIGCLAVLLGGMVVLHIALGEQWIEARQAIDRAIFPLVTIAFVWITDITERIFGYSGER